MPVAVAVVVIAVGVVVGVVVCHIIYAAYGDYLQCFSHVFRPWAWRCELFSFSVLLLSHGSNKKGNPPHTGRAAFPSPPTPRFWLLSFFFQTMFKHLLEHFDCL
ncbi:unnamed protein product [Polarella glacialis]|uniref:Uncharacterized protein n=1 Tax=Polarella glacialis TaxID=89957 RepID=A0A813I080_POLGL|nr:unnamed protein product [Polarella glacialis]